MYYSIFKIRFSAKGGSASGGGWCGIVGDDKAVKRIILPIAKRKPVLQRIQKEYPKATKNSSALKKSSQVIINYFNGTTRRLVLPIDLDGYTEFERKAYKSLSQVSYGKLITYCGLARSIGKPKSARAVGNTMAKNPLPLVIPCHRVVKSDGSIGNFSAEGGVALKKQLLELEALNK